MIRNIVFVVFLIVGLIAGLGVGVIVFPQTVTSTQTITTTQTQSVMLTETRISVETISTTIYSTLTNIVREVSYSTTTRTVTSISTTVYFLTLYRKIYPSETETILVRDSGSGGKDTRPFTLNETSDLKITVKIYPAADLQYVMFAWYLFIPEIEKWIKNGQINYESGTFEFYASHIPAGNYYVKVLAANCKWEITVEKVRT